MSTSSSPGHDVANGIVAHGDDLDSKATPAIEFAQQAQRLAQFTPEQEKARGSPVGATQAVEATFVTAQDPVIITANGGRLPAVPVDEALRLNKLKDELDDRESKEEIPVPCSTRTAKDGTFHGLHRECNMSSDEAQEADRESMRPEAPLRKAVPASRTNPLFPPMPIYGPSRTMRVMQCWFFRCTSAVLSLCFLIVIVLGAAFTSIPKIFKHLGMRLTLRDPAKLRPFHEEEVRRQKARNQADHKWQEKHSRKGQRTPDLEREDEKRGSEEFIPTEGGPDPLICDVGYYARRVGLDVENFDVETEDGFVIELWHVFNPREHTKARPSALAPRGPTVFQDVPTDMRDGQPEGHYADGDKKYPVLMIHGLLQSSGAYCSNDDDSFAFYLAKSGYDVWLGNNRCGFNPRHVLLDYADPRMWSWNIRQMGVMDLPALISRVLTETGFPKLGLVCHSQGTTQTLVALAKEQRPEIGEKISVFCALAPAAYAGPLIGKAYFKFMYIITPAMFRCIFGIHAFIPLMMQAHKILPAGIYGFMGYRVFSFLFNWTDTRWERSLRDRMFQFAPVYVSAESMRWWLGRECFAKQKCILATREEWMMEDEEDEEEDHVVQKYYEGHTTDTERPPPDRDIGAEGGNIEKVPSNKKEERGQFAWYNEQFPPLALWVCGNDDLVDGRRLLRRFDRGREPHVKVVHKKIIEGYEHLDVIWAMDAIEKVAKEIKEVIWRTVPLEARKVCRTPTGCEDIVCDENDDNDDAGNEVHAPARDSHSNDDYNYQPEGDDEKRQRLAERRNISPDMSVDAHTANGHISRNSTTSQNSTTKDSDSRHDIVNPVSPTQIDSTSGEWTKGLRQDVRDFQT